MPTFDGCDIDHFILTDKEGKQYVLHSLRSAVITDTTVCEGAEDTDEYQIFAHIPEEMNFAMEIQQTHKQNRATIKLIKTMENRARRRYRTYLRFLERLRRARLKGATVDDITKIYIRSKYQDACRTWPWIEEVILCDRVRV